MASAGLMVKIGVPPTTVAITPASVQLHPGETVQFKAVVSGTVNQAVPWEVNSVAGGNSRVGTISASGLDTAPSVLSNPAGPVLAINAPSVAGNSSNPPAYVTLLSGPPLLTAVLPTPISVGNFTISVSGGNFLNGAALATGTPLVTQFPQNSYFASQLQQVAQIIQVRAALGPQRQIFFVSMGGFDTHTGQLPQQDCLFNDLNASLSALCQATVGMGVASNLTTFTLSDFRRTWLPNSTGTDHAWDSHHIVMGGAVKGGDFYGTFPTLVGNGPDDATGQGRWVPTTSLDQYAATLPQWFGVAATDLPTIFPNLANFSTPTLGFMG